jgi:hypothetical protein
LDSDAEEEMGDLGEIFLGEGNATVRLAKGRLWFSRSIPPDQGKWRAGSGAQTGFAPLRPAEKSGTSFNDPAFGFSRAREAFPRS